MPEFRDSRVRRAWKAGQWAKAVLVGRSCTPNRSVQLDIWPRYCTILRADGLSKPLLCHSAASYWRVIRDIATSNSISHAGAGSTLLGQELQSTRSEHSPSNGYFGWSLLFDCGGHRDCHRGGWSLCPQLASSSGRRRPYRMFRCRAYETGGRTPVGTTQLVPCRRRDRSRQHRDGHVVFGPSLRTIVPLVLEDGGVVSPTGTKAEVLVVDCAEQVLFHMRAFDQSEESVFNFNEDSPFEFPALESLLASVRAWARESSERRTAFYTPDEEEELPPLTPDRPTRRRSESPLQLWPRTCKRSWGVCQQCHNS